MATTGRLSPCPGVQSLRGAMHLGHTVWLATMVLSVVELFAVGHETGQAGNPIAVRPGDSIVNASLYRPHVARVTQTVVRDGKAEPSTTFINDMTLSTVDGVAAHRIVTTAQGWNLEVLLSQRSFALLRYKIQVGDDSYTSLQFEGAKVRGRAKSAKDAVERDVEHLLETAAIPAGMVDGVVGALPLAIGFAAKIPVFQPGQPTVEWKTYRVTRQEPVKVNGRTLQAWVVEEQGRISGTMWLVDEPPYLVKWVMRSPNNRELIMEQTLLSVY